MYCHKCGKKNKDNLKYCVVCRAPLVVPGKSKETAKTSSSPLSMGKGRYLIIQKLGSGGMGKVFLARDTKMEGNIVIKEMTPPDTEEKGREYYLDKFKQEAKLLFRLSFPGIPKVLDYFMENDRYYIVMEYIEGENLDKIVNNRLDKKITIDEFITWMEKLMDILEFLHTRKPPIIHRDIKPANIMLDSHKRIYLVDFGIATVLDPAIGSGTSIGTFGYASPEHYVGKFELASDIYSLGASFHYLLTGEHPRKRPPFEYPPIDNYLDDVPDSMVKLFDRMLVKDPNKRFQNVGELRRAFSFFKREYNSESGVHKKVPILQTKSDKKPKKIINPFKNVRKKEEDEKADKASEATNDIKDRNQDDSGSMTLAPPNPFNIQTMDQLSASFESNVPTEPIQGKSTVEMDHGKKTLTLPVEKTPPKLSDIIKPFLLPVIFTCIAIFIGAVMIFGKPFITKKPPKQPESPVLTTVMPTESPSPSPSVNSTDSPTPSPSASSNSLTAMEPEKKIREARVRIQEKDPLGAIELLSPIIEADPQCSYPEAFLERAGAYKMKGDIEKAIEDYSLILDRIPEQTIALIERCRLYIKNEELEKAVDDFVVLKKTVPNHIELLELRTSMNKEILIRAGNLIQDDKPEMAVDILEKVNEVFPEDQNIRKELLKAYSALARSFESRGDTAKAVAVYDKAISTMPDDLELRKKVADVYSESAQRLRKLGKYDQALQTASKALEYDPDNYRALVILASIQIMKDKPLKAIETANRAISLKPDSHFAYVMRGEAYYQQGKTGPALADFKKAEKSKGPLAAHARMRIKSLGDDASILPSGTPTTEPMTPMEIKIGKPDNGDSNNQSDEEDKIKVPSPSPMPSEKITSPTPSAQAPEKKKENSADKSEKKEPKASPEAPK